MSLATLSSRIRLDGVSLHALHLADLYLTLDAAAAYAVTRLRPTGIDPATLGRPPDHGLTGLNHRPDHRGGIVGGGPAVKLFELCLCLICGLRGGDDEAR